MAIPRAPYTTAVVPAVDLICETRSYRFAVYTPKGGQYVLEAFRETIGVAADGTVVDDPTKYPAAEKHRLNVSLADLAALLPQYPNLVADISGAIDSLDQNPAVEHLPLA